MAKTVLLKVPGTPNSARAFRCNPRLEKLPPPVHQTNGSATALEGEWDIPIETAGQTEEIGSLRVNKTANKISATQVEQKPNRAAAEHTFGCAIGYRICNREEAVGLRRSEAIVTERV